MKFILFLFIFLISSSMYGQGGYEEILELLKKNRLDEAKTKVDQLVLNDDSPKAWMYRAVVYQSLHESSDAKFNTLDDDPLEEAYISYRKSMDTDLQKEFLQMNLKSLGVLANLFVKKGMDTFNSGDFKKALHYFENSLEINNMPAIMYLDTMLIYNTALTAEKAGDYVKARRYYKELIVLGFEKPRMYKELAMIFKTENDIDAYVKTLKEGVSNCVEGKSMLVVELVNYYLSVGMDNEAIEYLEMAIQMEPSNANFYYVRGSLFDQVSQSAEAEKYYLTAIGYDPDNVDALYNLGAIYFNRGVDMEKKAMTKKDKQDADAMYLKALPHFEKVHQIDPSEISTMQLLYTLYKIAGNEDKQKEMELKLKEVQ